jgi:hypothetical protein
VCPSSQELKLLCHFPEHSWFLVELIPKVLQFWQCLKEYEAIAFLVLSSYPENQKSKHLDTDVVACVCWQAVPQNDA